MKTYTQTKQFKLFTFNELSIEAQERAEQTYLSDEWVQSMKAEFFTEWATEEIETLFKDSVYKPEVYYSLTYCQGDGLHFEGSVNVLTFLKEFKDDLNFKEDDYLKLLNYLEEDEIVHNISHAGGHYAHCYSVNHDFDLDYFNYYYNGENSERLEVLLNELEAFIEYHYEAVCLELEDIGYKHFYSLSEFDYDCLNDYYYLEDGKEFGLIEDIDAETV